MGAHQLVGIGARQLWHRLAFVALQQVQSLPQQFLALDLSAVILHAFADGHVQLPPVHSVLNGHRGIEAFFFRVDVRGIRLCQRNRLRPFRRLPPGIVAGGTGIAAAVRGKQLISGGIDAVKIRLQIPVVHDAAGRPEELALLSQKGGRLPAGAVALQHMLRWVKAPLGIVLQNRDFGLAFFAHHQAPDRPPLGIRHAGEIRVEGQFVSPAYQLVERQRLRSAVFILCFVDHAALEEELLSGCGIVTLRDRFELVSVPVDIGDLNPSGIHHRGSIPGVVVVAGAVGRKAPPGGREFSPHRLFHHCELDSRSPAHRMAGAHRLHWAEFAQSHQVRIEEPDARRA